MGHHYKVFNKSKDDAEEKKKKMENPAALGSTHLRDKIFLFFPFYFYKFFEIRNQPFTPKQVRSKKRKKEKGVFKCPAKSLSTAWKLFSRFSSAASSSFYYIFPLLLFSFFSYRRFLRDSVINRTVVCREREREHYRAEDALDIH
jgi:hypothetical protein